MTNATRACPYCDEPMTNPRRKQCGAPACYRAYKAAAQRAFQHRHKAEHGNYYSRKFDKGEPRQHTITCQQCGREAVVTKRGARYCTQRCWYDAKHAAHAQIEPVWKAHVWAPRPIQVVILKPLRRRWYSARCPMCDTWFVTDNPRDQNCSRRCGRKASKDRERARKREAFVAPVSRQAVYERDRWTCQLCGKRVRRDAVVPDPKAPVLDHIVPLARGGTHEPANVQLAHFSCNSIKSDGAWGRGEQLALIG